MKNIVIKISALIVSHGTLLLMKEKSSRDNQYHWNIIGGTYEPKKDRNLLEAIQREAMEEAGAGIKNIKLLNIFEVEREQKTIIQFIFLANLKSKNFRLAPRHEQKKRGEDIIEIRFFNKKVLRKMRRKDFFGDRSYLAVKNWLMGGKELFRLLK